ncbi:hypothetical protein SESBI_42555 [Sesbania bispinosa]|nr:hypothetical protein SESBI_42555 [Sesbania bispinosa]
MRRRFCLRLHSYGLRVVSSLRCRCQSGYSPQRVFDGSASRFDPTRVLDFVLDAAVLPWVEAPRLVDADRVVAQVRLVFEEPELGVTIVKLTHTDVHEEDRPVF